MKHLGLVEPPASRAGALLPQVAAVFAAGRKIEAIKLYRQETGEGLKHAKATVEGAVATVAAAGHCLCSLVVRSSGIVAVR